MLKVVGSDTSKFIWDPVADAYQSELDATNATQVVYTSPATHFGQLISQRRSSTSRWYHPDSLGSTRALSDSSQATTDTYLYDAWGNPLSSSGTTVNPFRWVGNVGYYFDPESGLYYIRARVYQPTIARWISADPLFYMLAKAGMMGLASRDPFGYLDGPYCYGAYFATRGIDPLGYGLGSDIAWHLFWRIIQIGKWWDVGDTMYFNSGGEFEAAFGADMNFAFRKIAEGHKDNVMCDKHNACFRQILDPAKSASGEWRWPSTSSFDAGWWLNGAHKVKAEVKYCIYCIDGEIRMTNITSSWTWEDQIDARGIVQWWNAKQGAGEVIKGIPNLIIESIIWDKLVDGLLDADYRVVITTGWVRSKDINTSVKCSECECKK